MSFARQWICFLRSSTRGYITVTDSGSSSSVESRAVTIEWVLGSHGRRVRLKIYFGLCNLLWLRVIVHRVNYKSNYQSKSRLISQAHKTWQYNSFLGLYLKYYTKGTWLTILKLFPKLHNQPTWYSNTFYSLCDGQIFNYVMFTLVRVQVSKNSRVF
jgi:hypothetical protein